MPPVRSRDRWDGAKDERERMVRHVRWLPAVVLVMMLGAGLVACTSGSGAVTPDSELTVSLRDNFFEPATIKVPAGKVVRITFVNQGRNPHKVKIDGLFSEVSLRPGES